jgi:uncharacterized protein YceH (UPF0502 family)
MLALKPNECRVLGVIVEKAFTVPAAYPLTLNSFVVGSNQRNNREPMLNLDEEAALDALDGLRAKGLVVEAFLSGSRVAKYRHNARETLGVTTEQLVILVELLLRGPQSPGELRGRAERMAPLGSLEQALGVIESLVNRPEPLVRELPPSGRARRFGQLLCPDLHPLDVPSGDDRGGGASAPPGERLTGEGSLAALQARVSALEAEVAVLKSRLDAVTS